MHPSSRPPRAGFFLPPPSGAKRRLRAPYDRHQRSASPPVWHRQDWSEVLDQAESGSHLVRGCRPLGSPTRNQADRHGNDALPPVLSSPESKPVPKAHASGLSYWGKAWCFAANDFRTLISFRKRYVIHAPNAAISGGQLSSTFRYSSSIFQSTSHMFPHSTCDVRILPLSMLGLSLVKRLVNFDLWEYHKSNGKPQIKW